MNCTFCGEEYEFSFGHHCPVVQAESKQPMPQPDLVSKLREVIAEVPHVYVDGPNCGWLNDLGIACGKSSDKGRHIRYGPQEDYPGYHHFFAEQVHDESKCPTCELESLLGLEGPSELCHCGIPIEPHPTGVHLIGTRKPSPQEEAYGVTLEPLAKEVLAAHACGPSQPEPLEFHKPGQIPVNTPMCDKCGKMFLECQCSQPSPSTPIVPSTPDDPRFDGVVVEVAEEFAILEEDIPRLRQILARLQPAAGLSAEQVQRIVELHHNDGIFLWASMTADLNALLAAKPVGISIDALEDLMQQFKQREAKIRKSVLEEASRHQSIQFSIDLETHPYFCCSECDWKGDVWADHIRALAERPAPAGEVKGKKS